MSEPNPADRRRSRRVPLAGELYVLGAGGAREAVRVRDVSRTGMALEAVDLAWRPSARLTVQVHVEGQRLPVVASGTVVWRDRGWLGLQLGPANQSWAYAYDRLAAGGVAGVVG